MDRDKFSKLPRLSVKTYVQGNNFDYSWIKADWFELWLKLARHES